MPAVYRQLRALSHRLRLFAGWPGEDADEEDRSGRRAVQARRVREALAEIGVSGLTVTEVKGFGREGRAELSS
jgi:hypothetical protein